eukprot:TRINITY_DN6118_c4_g1_i1.p1 TRINITY_DN6118_c4_g1~~TRINITY_DN6118_c4_g1_i1.p1  ORF type:complete len:297 (+),score=6.67 TRINITY_DN6118_c4_g1_i1:67-957(+)
MDRKHLETLIGRALILVVVLGLYYWSSLPISRAEEEAPWVAASGEHLDANELRSSLPSKKMTLRAWIDHRVRSSDLIFQGFAPDGRGKSQPWPAGMSAAYLAGARARVAGADCALKGSACTHGLNTKLLLSVHGVRDPLQRYSALATHRFVMSPARDAADCHSHYEVLLFRGVPVIDESGNTSAIRGKYRGLPVAWVESFEGVTDSMLESMWAKMMDTEYDFGPLLLSGWDAAGVGHTIRRQGNFWCCLAPQWFNESGKWYRRPWYGDIALPSDRVMPPECQAALASKDSAVLSHC